MVLHIPLSLLLLLRCKNGSRWPSQAPAFPPCNLSLSPPPSRPPLRPSLRHHRLLHLLARQLQAPHACLQPWRRRPSLSPFSLPPPFPPTRLPPHQNPPKTHRQLSWFLNGRLLIKTQDHRAQKHETPILSPNKLLNHKVKTQDRVPTDTIQKHQTLMLSPNELLNHGEKPSVEISENRQKSGVSYAVKAVMMGLIIRIYDYSDRINPTVILIIYCLHIYLCLEIILAIVAALARAVLGLELEPQFNEPYLSASLQDFWGRRWNLMVNRILRPTVYNPVLGVSAKYLGRKWATFPAVMATFFVSGLMHELIFFYLGRARPTWEITWFFLLHGACVAVEVAVKKALRGRCRLPGMLGTILTVGFVMLTGFWLFFPQLLRCEADVKAFAEYAALGAFVKDVGRALTLGARSALGL
ncbi:PREDICTED: acyl-CoA--sterol O-acyltransferase 1-like isoform X2 [Ipomoea nil]|uniref:acyl-CoA--sterol O-acyltransferase 1-like isoform X2 n=1 Tax=Ipomoea nil TaxID=35883 RepID=UPI00090107E3|nr:PREDICTED: acyl-CoA--sterol O-acyltransferase 1-like isoform X2 [Ipomoea nil]